MKRKLFFLLCALLTMFSGSVQKVKAAAADYLTGWTEVTSLPTSSDIDNYYYVFVATEADLMVAEEVNSTQNTRLAPVYRTPTSPLTGKRFVWMLAYDETHGYGIKNLGYSTYFLQTNTDSPWQIHAYYETKLSTDDWTKWTFAYDAVSSSWTIQNGKYPTYGSPAKDCYWGPWNAKAFNNGEPMAGNKDGENVGKFKIYQILRSSYNTLVSNHVVTSTYITNPSFEANGDVVAETSTASAATGWTFNWSGYTNSNAVNSVDTKGTKRGSIGDNVEASDGTYFMGIRLRWDEGTYTANTSQVLTLPKGSYLLTADYRAWTKQSSATLTLAVLDNSGTLATTNGNMIASASSFNNPGFETFTLPFTTSLSGVTIKFTLNGKQNTQAIYDNINLIYTANDTEVLQAAIVQANSINAVTGDLTSAIAAAQAVYDGVNNTPAYQTTIDEAITTLKNAIKLSVAGIAKNDGDDLSYLIANNGFESSSAITENKTTSTTIDYASTGWIALSTSTPNSCGAVVTYGSDKTMNGVTAPSADNNGDSGNALGVSIGWSATVAYQTAPITLPAGFYRLVVRGFNNNSEGSSFESKFGFVPTEGDGFISSKTSYTYNTWETDEVEFTLAEATEGVFQIGGKAGNNTSTTHAKVFLDNISLTYYSSAVALEKMHLSEEITTANGISSSMSANVGTGVFQITTAAGTAFTTAIATAQAVYDNGSATADEVTAAITTLQAAEKTFVSTINAPDPEKRYCIVLNNNSEWTYDGKAITYIANGRNDMGLYNIQYQAAPNSNYAQAFILTQVTGNTYKMSQIDVDGNTRYICTGVPYSGNTGQIRTTTDASDALVVKIIPTSTAGVFNIYNTEASNYIGSQDAGVYTVNNHINFTIQEATQATPNLTVAANVNWATFMSPFAVSLSSLDDVTAFSITGVENDELTTEEVTTTIPANTPVLLYRKTTGSNYAPALSGYGTAYQDSYVSGLLTGSFVKSPVTEGENHYLLQKNNSVVAFYNVAASGLYIGAYRAYLTMPAASARPVIYFPGEDVPTAINAIEATETEGLKDGKYLIGGKIVLVKNGMKYGANGQKLK